MPPSNIWKNLAGTLASFFQFGLGRSGIKSIGTGELEVRNSDDTDYAVIRAAAPVGDDDVVTKFYADSLECPMIVSAQVDGNTTPTNTAVRRHIVVNSNGTAANIGDVWFDDGSNSGNASLLLAQEGRTIAVTDALTGGTATFEADSIYIWDDDGTQWVKIGDVGGVTGAVREIRYTITNSATQDSTTSIDANSRIIFCSVEVTLAYSGGSNIAVGNTTTSDLIMGTSQNNAQSVNIYDVEQDTDWGGSNSVVRTTITGAPAAGTGVIVVRYTTPNG